MSRTGKRIVDLGTQRTAHLNVRCPRDPVVDRTPTTVAGDRQRLRWHPGRARVVKEFDPSWSDSARPGLDHSQFKDSSRLSLTAEQENSERRAKHRLGERPAIPPQARGLSRHCSMRLCRRPPGPRARCRCAAPVDQLTEIAIERKDTPLRSRQREHCPIGDDPAISSAVHRRS
jgi:hypothetical protein